MRVQQEDMEPYSVQIAVAEGTHILPTKKKEVEDVLKC